MDYFLYDLSEVHSYISFYVSLNCVSLCALHPPHPSTLCFVMAKTMSVNAIFASLLSNTVLNTEHNSKFNE